MLEPLYSSHPALCPRPFESLAWHTLLEEMPRWVAGVLEVAVALKAQAA